VLIYNLKETGFNIIDNFNNGEKGGRKAKKPEVIRLMMISI